MMNEELTTWEFVIKPCPWCGNTPTVSGPMHEETWRWSINCANHSCSVRPKGRHVCIRKKQKYSNEIVFIKLSKLVNDWNSIVFREAYEKTKLTFKIEGNKKGE